MRLPLRLDAELLCVYDADGELVFYRDVVATPREHAKRARELRRTVAAVNFTRFCTTDGMERAGALPAEKVMEIESDLYDAETHFSGPIGLVRS